MNQNPPPFPHPFHYGSADPSRTPAAGVSYSAVSRAAHPSQVPRTSHPPESPNLYVSSRAHPQRRSPVPPPAFPLAPPFSNAVPVTPQAPVTHSRIPPSPTWHYPAIPSQNMDPRAAPPIDPSLINRAHSTSSSYAPRTTGNGIRNHRDDNYNDQQQYTRDDESRDKGPVSLPFAAGRMRQAPPPTVGSCRLRRCQAPAPRSELERWGGFCSDQHMREAINAGNASLCPTCRRRACRVGSRFCSEACRR
ncbi:hypothetical protein BC826DRAFT_529348 [Russula brevipes]|nr:hypothetical protein BC826DRAFT_529348 [Russula brevipes]